MEAKGQRWRMHLPEFKHSRRFPSPTTRDGDRGRTETSGDRGGLHKSVTMAPTSRYLTDRQYVTRKPLFSAEQHASILKKTHSQRNTEKEKQLDLSRREESQQAELTPDSFSLSRSDLSSPSASREDLGSPLALSELRTRLCRDGSPLRGSRSAHRSLSSSVLEVQRLNPPLRPQLTSTVLYPTYTPRSGHARRGHALLREGGGEAESKLRASGGRSKTHPMSPHQANYWACAIPKALPPSADRRSAGWDPNREYQALLDYTYPLRPGQVVTEWDSSKLHGDSLLQIDPTLQDSGIELDHLCSSTSLSGLGVAVSGTGRSGEQSRSPDLQTFTRSSEGTPLSLTDPAGSSEDSLDAGANRGGTNRSRSDRHVTQRHASSSSSTSAFIHSTRGLPQSRCASRCVFRCVCGDVDEEFWPLPQQLEELQQLSRQVREVTAQLSRPVAASWESLGPGTTSILSSVTLPERQEAEDKEEEEEETEVAANQDTDGGRYEPDREDMTGHRDPGAVRRSSGAWAEPVEGGQSRSGLREVEALVEQLCGLTLPGIQRTDRENQEQRVSLMQHIQVFCSHLQQLIRQLYAVSERMELLAEPTVDIDSVKSSLAEYQVFQREVSSHQPLTSSVLHTGQLLLSCINATSPFLRDTLLLIERQSGALESHTEHFFSSILSAMDSLTRPGPVQPSRDEGPGPVGVQGSAL